MRAPLLLLWSLKLSFSEGFTTGNLLYQSRHSLKPQRDLWNLFSTKRKQKSESEAKSILDLEEPAGIVGAEFFGGNKQKEELFDPVAEAKAGEELAEVSSVYNRFEDTKAFGTERVSVIGKAIQERLNLILLNVEQGKEGGMKVEYAGNLRWESCFDAKNAKNPLMALEEAMEFYKELSVAIVSGEEISEDRFRLRWQMSVVWPIFWGPRILLTGSSQITLKDGMTIVSQLDTLDSSTDLISTITSQLSPRFWDTYHIGMTPSAEIMTRVPRKQGLLPKSYKVFEIPSRLVASATQLDSAAGREDGNALIVPNHAFTCVIKTMGPQKQEFTPASPLQVQIMPSEKGRSLPRLKWSIPIAVGFQANVELPLPGEDPEARPDSEPAFEYEFQPRRLVATLPYGGGPQDVDISDVRKRLYDNVVKDGFAPLLDESGRPQFFFLQNGVKACYTDEGLGMCVYEFRPEAVQPNEVGIELVVS